AEFATQRSNKVQATEYGKVMHRTAEALVNCRHPLIAQIHGICVGGGLEIAALCDLRICGESSRFGAPIKNLGLVMAYAEMAPLVRLVGSATALEILLEGRVFDAAEAREKRLITRVVPDDQVVTEVRATAQRIAEGAPLVARWHKKFARRLAEGTPLTATELDECFDCFDTEDFRIGYAAFLAKQKPEFTGR
ncbi:MAG: enoyl-CoA hydratase-related protein, partial [Burkholderiaceae bacterium]